jgi:hypothetical protein
MRIACPSCSAQFELDAAIQADAARGALMRALAMPAPLAGALALYLGMFRPKGRVLAMDRADRLMGELLPMLQDETVTRNGNSRRAPLNLWSDAIDQMVDLRNTGKLTLPLKSHGYLLEIVFAAADKLDAKAERETEQQRRTGEHRVAGADRLQKLDQLSRIRADFNLQLIEKGEAIRRLRELGYGEEALNA